MLGLSGSAACVAHVRRVPEGRPVVTLCAVHAIDGFDPAALERLAKELHLGSYNCSLMLNSGEYQLLVLEAPNVPPDELKAAIRWRVKDLLDYHIDDATLDVLDIPPDKNAPSRNHSMYAVAAKNELVRNRVELMAKARIPLSVIDIPELAQRNIATLLENGRGVAMLSFDDDGGLLTFNYGGELYLARRIEIGLSQLRQSDPEMRQRHFDRVTLELQRSLDHFDRQFNFIPLSRLVLAPLPAGLGLQEYLAANLYVPVAVLDLNELFDFSLAPDLPQPLPAHCLLALGAALRLEEKVP